MTDKAILHREPLLDLIPLTERPPEYFAALNLNWRAFVALALAAVETDEPADRPDTLDETA